MNRAVRRLVTFVACFCIAVSTLSAEALNLGSEKETAASEEAAKEVKMLIPVGRTVGIRLSADGVIVVGITKIPTENGEESPALDCGLQTGDIITHINSSPIESAPQAAQIIEDGGGETLKVSVQRGENELQLMLDPIEYEGSYKIGAWIRDGIAGIGTMTFYDPETKKFGALGHGINDMATTQLLPITEGFVTEAAVAGVNKAEEGAPGELVGLFKNEEKVGSIYANTNEGVFGILNDGVIENENAMEIRTLNEVKLGDVTILANVTGTAIEEYSAEIVKIVDGDLGNRDMTIKITDDRLIQTTGGIVQGMSGSPIIQDGKLIGAVTHVLINDPTKGYGIGIENMLEAAR